MNKKKLVIIVNLGSPKSLTLQAIRSFLGRFLRDKRVVGLPRILWYPILFGIILPFRAQKLKKQYKEIWFNNSSPLIYYTKSLCEKLHGSLYCKEEQSAIEFRYAFCYTTPTIAEVLDDFLMKNELSELRIIPLYPQNCSATNLPVLDQVYNYFTLRKFMPTITIVNGFSQNDKYIIGVCATILESFKSNEQAEVLIFSYHSIPQKLITAGDKYYEECMATTKRIVEQLGLKQEEYIVTFQSKFGYDKWLLPSTVQTLVKLAQNGVQHVDIVCPGFICDCLETLEEIKHTNAQLFIQNGGKKYNYIGCLNDSNYALELIYSLLI